ncbi:MAG: cytochrome C biogenesis protein [Chloroflexi bacterium]|nr:cytochrome C biogenesis protein [Chloroflexota bacterium]
MGELTIAAAVIAGLVSFLSPCVLPVVPAYLGQLGAIAVSQRTVALQAAMASAGATSGTTSVVTPPPSSVAARRRQVLPHALLFVLGFGGVFTILGTAAQYAFQGLTPQQLDVVRFVGGAILVVLGLNLAGVLRLGALMRTWRPLDERARRSGRPSGATNALGAFGLGAVFGFGWTPCVGPTLGAIFALSAGGPSTQAAVLFTAYSLGLGIPFVLLALALDRAPAITRPLLRHGRLIEIVGGLLVVVIGLAVMFDWLTFIAARFSFLTPRV